MRVDPPQWDKRKRLEISLCCVRTPEGSHLQARERAVPQNRLCWRPNLELASLHNREISVLLKPCGLWYLLQKPELTDLLCKPNFPIPWELVVFAY